MQKFKVSKNTVEDLDDDLKTYLKQIVKYPLLSKQEEGNLTWEYKRTKCPKIRQELINRNLRLVVNIAKKYMNRGLDFLDLIQEGNLGLMKGIDKFDCEKGYKLSTYVTWWIKQGIQRAIIDKGANIRLPVHYNELIYKVKKVIKEFELNTERPPTFEEIQAILPDRSKSSLQKVFDHIKYNSNSTVSINTIISEDREELEIFQSSNNDTFKEATDRILKQHIKSLLNQLPIKKQEILKLRFGLSDGKPKSLKEVGKIFNITHERVRQLEQSALKQLRKSDLVDKIFIPV